MRQAGVADLLAVSYEKVSYWHGVGESRLRADLDNNVICTLLYSICKHPTSIRFEFQTMKPRGYLFHIDQATKLCTVVVHMMDVCSRSSDTFQAIP